MIAPARVAAYDVLRAVANGRADLPAALAQSRGGRDQEQNHEVDGGGDGEHLQWQVGLQSRIARDRRKVRM